MSRHTYTCPSFLWLLDTYISLGIIHRVVETRIPALCCSETQRIKTVLWFKFLWTHFCSWKRVPCRTMLAHFHTAKARWTAWSSLSMDVSFARTRALFQLLVPSQNSCTHSESACSRHLGTSTASCLILLHPLQLDIKFWSSTPCSNPVSLDWVAFWQHAHDFLCADLHSQLFI